MGSTALGWELEPSSVSLAERDDPVSLYSKDGVIFSQVNT